MIDLSLFPNSLKLMVDLHCHPSIKPFGRSFPGNINSTDPDQPNSIWKYDPPTARDKFLNITLGITRFSQANFTSLHRGNVRVAFCALNPVEQGFFRARIGTGKLADNIYNLVAGIGISKINFIQQMNDYWNEFENEYDFYKQLDGIAVPVDGKNLKYKLTKDYSEVEQNLMDADIVSVVLTIEGSYVFNPSISGPFNAPQILANINSIKSRPVVPFIVSISHHFYNYTGGHARSLQGIVALVVDQKYGMYTGITNFGKVVARTLLDKNTGKRIYIDLKHMSVQMRRDYYSFIDSEFSGEDIPFIVTHGALNGFQSIYNNDPSPAKKGMFYEGDVNFYDDEIILISRSNGIFGLQLDDRLISAKKIWWRDIFYSRKKKLKFRARLLWNHIQRVAEALDRNDLDSWGTVAIGTDYDGLVDPPNGYWTSEEMPQLYSYLHENASDFMKPDNNRLHLQSNACRTADEIMRNLFSENARRFMERYYK